MKNKKKRNLILLLVVLLGISIGFALLSTTLYINGTSTIKGNVWDIHWGTPTESQGSVTATTPVRIKDNTDSQEIEFSVGFDLPGDYYEFTVDAINAGTIDGIITAYKAAIYDSTGTTELDPEDPDYPDLIYTVTYADGTTVPAVGNVLAKRTDAEHPTTQTYKVKVQFDPEAQELPEVPDGQDSINYVFKLNVNYQQYKAPAQNNNQP